MRDEWRSAVWPSRCGTIQGGEFLQKVLSEAMLKLVWRASSVNIMDCVQ